MVGRDGKTTAVVAYPVKGMTNRRREVMERVYEVANREIGIAPEQLKAGGPTVDGAAIDAESKRSLEPVSLDVDRDRVSADLVSVAGPATDVVGHVLFCSLRSDCSGNSVFHGRQDESDHGYVADADVHSGRFRMRPYRELLPKSLHRWIWDSFGGPGDDRWSACPIILSAVDDRRWHDCRWGSAVYADSLVWFLFRLRRFVPA